MKQTVNLCPREKGVAFLVGAKTMLGLWALFALLLVICGVSLKVTNYYYESKLLNLVKSEASDAGRGQDEKLIVTSQEKIQLMQEKIKGLKALGSDLLKDKDTKISAIIEAFFNNENAQIKLNKIELDKRGDKIIIKGVSDNAKSVPQFIANLQKEPSLRGRNFSRFDIKRLDNQSHSVVFNIESSVE